MRSFSMKIRQKSTPTRAWSYGEVACTVLGATLLLSAIAYGFGEEHTLLLPTAALPLPGLATDCTSSRLGAQCLSQSHSLRPLHLEALTNA